MLRIAVISDSHFDINSRWEETLRIHDWFANDIRERQVDAVLHAGDLGPLVPIRQFKPNERLAVAEWMQNITEHCPMVIVRGNHDPSGDLEIFNKLETEHELTITESPRMVLVTTSNGQFSVACMPWPMRAELLARLDKSVTHEQTEETIGDALRSIFLNFGMQWRDSEVPKILLMHAMVRGSLTSTGQPLVGCDCEVDIETIALARAQFNALGHVHRADGNEWEFNGAPFAYIGSPRRTNFGESEAKSYTVIEFDDAGTMTWKRTPVPCTQMWLVEGSYNPDNPIKFDFTTEIPEFGGSEDSEVRFRYHVNSDHREAAREAALRHQKAAFEKGGVSVFKIEEVVIPTTRARVPEVATASSTQDLLKLLWESKSDVPSSQRQELLFSKLEQLEGASNV